MSTAILVTLLVCAVGVCLTMFGWIVASKGKVDADTCEALRAKSELGHATFCPENREVLLRAAHERECNMKLAPLHTKMDSICRKVEQVDQKVDALATTARTEKEELRQWIADALRGATCV